MSREGTGLLSELPSSGPSHCVRPDPSWPVAHGDALVAMEFTQVGAGSGAEALQGATPHFADTQPSPQNPPLLPTCDDRRNILISEGFLWNCLL